MLSFCGHFLERVATAQFLQPALPDTSSKFIDQLSNVYRYLLFNQQNKIVKLSEEMAFLESYIYLLKIRFQDNLEIKKDITDHT